MRERRTAARSNVSTVSAQPERRDDEESAHFARRGSANQIMARKKYYAVATGKVPGIYETWAECEMQVKLLKLTLHIDFSSCVVLTSHEAMCADERISKSKVQEFLLQRLSSRVCTSKCAKRECLRAACQKILALTLSSRQD